MSITNSSVDDKNVVLEEYEPLECPICDKERHPNSLNSDGSVTFVCKVDPVWQEGKPFTAIHAQAYSWRISADGDLMEKRGSRWVAI